MPLPRAGGGGDPDWLTERLAREAAMHSRSEWSGRWSRRLGAWGAAGVLLALLAGGGLWLYDQSQVEGALVVVANTNPNPGPATATLAAPARPGPVRSAPALPTNTNLATTRTPAATPPPVTPPAATPAPSSVLPADTRSAGGVDAVGGLAGPSTAAAAGIEPTDRKVVPVPMAEAPAVTQPRHPRSHAKKRARVEARAAEPAREPSARQRREETLMQCRAHGYDERQCLQRGCEMTRYGFACKG
ncbi:hypothetical protein ACI48D_16860 [Massilia sp. LXY-6]|uniref:hypothetical protein n=1 Tax=Massilia sp. LXY-6 TaxID=3379823 RepID=UPI003EE3FC40